MQGFIVRAILDLTGVLSSLPPLFTAHETIEAIFCPALCAIRGGNPLKRPEPALCLSATDSAAVEPCSDDACSQITSEPGIVRLVEVVEQESRSGAARPTSMSALVIAAVNGAIAGRLDDAKVAAVLVCTAGVAGADGLLLSLDRLLAH